MIRAEFVVSEDNKPIAFSISGHSGFDVSPHDIVCASVSAMTNLAVNTVTEVFGIKAEVSADPDSAKVDFKIIDFDSKKDCAAGVLEGFFIELCELEKRYPKNVSVKKIQK